MTDTSSTQPGPAETPGRDLLWPPPADDPTWGHPRMQRWLHRFHRLRRADLAHPWRLDSVLAFAVVLIGLGIPSRLSDERPHGLFGPSTQLPLTLAVTTITAQGVVLLWRRRAPDAVFWTVLGLCLVQWMQGIIYRSDIALMIVLYGLARHARLRRLPWAAGATLAALVLAAVRVGPFVGAPEAVLFFLCSSATAAIALGLVARFREAQLAALADRAARMEVEREQRVQLATVEERARVSREMHDIVGHNLAIVIGLADGGASLAGQDPKRSAEALRIIGETGRQALSELRSTLGALRERPVGQAPGETVELSPQPGLADLPVLLDRIRAAGPRITYRTAGNPADAAPAVQLAAYRIAQEALTNALKHAGTGAAVEVAVRVRPDGLRLTVDDTGPAAAGSAGARPARAGRRTRFKGRRPEPAPARTPPAPPGPEPVCAGQGLVGIRERAALVGGTAAAGPRSSGGWRVRAWLPLAPEPPEPTT